MKCAHPTCQRGIGLVSHRRGWFGKRLYCSRDCRDSYVAEVRAPRVTRSFDPSLFELLFAPADAPGGLVPARSAAVRARAR
jgi:hypothetical protein